MAVNDAAREEVAKNWRGSWAGPGSRANFGATLQLESGPWAILGALEAGRADPSPASG